MENEINVTCTSKTSKIHPKNCPTEFTSILARPLEINEEWKVALTSITFKNDFKFDSNFHFRFSYYQYDISGNQEIKRINIEIDKNVKSVRHIFEIFTNALKSHVDTNLDSKKHGRQVGFVKLATEGILTIYFAKPTKFTLTPHLAMVLGVISNPFDSADINYQEESVEYEIGLEVNSQNSHTGGIFIGSTPIDFNFSLDQKFAQMEAIKEVPIGNGNVKKLKIVSLSTEAQGIYVTKDFDILDFHQLEYHHLQNLDFKLLAQSGSIYMRLTEAVVIITSVGSTWFLKSFQKVICFSRIE